MTSPPSFLRFPAVGRECSGYQAQHLGAVDISGTEACLKNSLHEHGQAGEDAKGLLDSEASLLDQGHQTSACSVGLACLVHELKH